LADSNFVVKNSLTVNSSFVANSSQVSLGTINATSNGVLLTTSSLTFGNSSVNASINTTSFSGTSNNATNLGGVAASGYVNTSGSYTISGNLNFTGTNTYFTGPVFNANTIVTNNYIQSANNKINSQTTNYTLANTDSGALILGTNATSMTITIPNTVPVGFRTMVTRLGTGNVVISNAAGVTLGSRTGAYTITTQYGSASIFMANATFAVVDGNI